MGSNQSLEKKILAHLNQLIRNEDSTILKTIDSIPTLDDDKTEKLKKLITQSTPHEQWFKCLADEYKLRWTPKFKEHSLVD